MMNFSKIWLKQFEIKWPSCQNVTKYHLIYKWIVSKIIKLANKGYKAALLEDSHFLNGLNVINGQITCKEVAEGFNMEYVDPKVALQNA